MSKWKSQNSLTKLSVKRGCKPQRLSKKETLASESTTESIKATNTSTKSTASTAGITAALQMIEITLMIPIAIANTAKRSTNIKSTISTGEGTQSRDLDQGRRRKSARKI